MKGENRALGRGPVARNVAAFASAFFAAALWLAVYSSSISADVTDCKGSSPDGQAICTEPLFSGYQYSLCDDQPAYTWAQARWCWVRGGTGAAIKAARMVPKLYYLAIANDED